MFADGDEAGGMKEREFFERVLGLSEPWVVKEVKLDLAGRQVMITVECRAGETWTGSDGKRWHIHSWEERQWRHLDTMQLETVIAARVPRLIDPATGGTEMAPVPWAQKGARWTVLFEAWAVRLFEAVPNVSKAADLLNLDWHSAWAIKRRAVERGLERRTAEPIAALGLDEKSFGRGQDYAAVLTDLAQHRVLEVHAARTQESAEQLLGQALTKEQRAGVAAVCIDMWPPFEAAIGTCLPQARIVYDPFHVVSHANEALDQVRRAEQRHRLAQGDETLTGSRPLWLHGFERLDRRRRQELRALLTPELKTGLAWALKEQLRDLWHYRRPSAARRFLDQWLQKVEASGLQPMKKVAKMITSHLTGIIAWFWHPISNGPAEGFNSAIQALKTLARGYRNFANFRVAILFHHGKLDLVPH